MDVDISIGTTPIEAEVKIIGSEKAEADGKTGAGKQQPQLINQGYPLKRRYEAFWISSRVDSSRPIGHSIIWPSDELTRPRGRRPQCACATATSMLERSARLHRVSHFCQAAIRMRLRAPFAYV
jgi:hypothetical protein